MSLLEPTFRINNKGQYIKSPLFPYDTHNPKKSQYTNPIYN